LTGPSKVCGANYERIVEIEDLATPPPDQAGTSNNPGSRARKTVGGKASRPIDPERDLRLVFRRITLTRKIKRRFDQDIAQRLVAASSERGRYSDDGKFTMPDVAPFIMPDKSVPFTLPGPTQSLPAFGAANTAAFFGSNAWSTNPQFPNHDELKQPTGNPKNRQSVAEHFAKDLRMRYVMPGSIRSLFISRHKVYKCCNGEGCDQCGGGHRTGGDC
jgi:hypothetical protein